MAEIIPIALKLSPYGTQHFLPILGRAKLTLQSVVRATIDTEVYMNKKDAEKLGIIQVQVGGKVVEVQCVK